MCYRCVLVTGRVQYLVPFWSVDFLSFPLAVR